MIENGNTRNVLKLVDDWLEIAYTDIEVAQLCYQNSYYLYQVNAVKPLALDLIITHIPPLTSD